MKLSVVCGLLFVTACNGQLDDSVAEDGDIETAASSLQILRHGYGQGHGHDHDQGQLSSALRRALKNGAARLASLQADSLGDNARNGLSDADPDDGGWDFMLPGTATAHTPTASPTNLYGGTALGAWAALQSGAASNRALTTLIDTAAGMQADPTVDSGPDFVFGVLLADLAENPGYAQLARDRYDAKRMAAGGANALGTQIRDARHAAMDDGLIAYDLGWLLLGAAALDEAFPNAGYDADADTYANLVVDDLRSAMPRFDLDDTHERFYTTGVAWSMVAAAWVGDHPLRREARDHLLDAQRGDGAWGWNADLPAADLQATAHALQTLSLSGSLNTAGTKAAKRGSSWLLARQANNGGWIDTTQMEIPLVDSEILLGLYLTQTEEGRDDGLEISVQHVAQGPSPANGGTVRRAAPLQ